MSIHTLIYHYVQKHYNEYVVFLVMLNLPYNPITITRDINVKECLLPNPILTYPK